MSRETRDGRGWRAAFVCAAMAAGACGCAIIGEQYVLARQFTESQVQAIRIGETTRKEVLERFGPPVEVARPEGGSMDDVLRRFTAGGGSGTGRLVYRYRTSALTWGNLCAYGQGGGGCMQSTPVLRERDLWLLVDEGTGRVVDRVLEETEREDGGASVDPWPGP